MAPTALIDVAWWEWGRGVIPDKVCEDVKQLLFCLFFLELLKRMMVILPSAICGIKLYWSVQHEQKPLYNLYTPQFQFWLFRCSLLKTCLSLTTLVLPPSPRTRSLSSLIQQCFPRTVDMGQWEVGGWVGGCWGWTALLTGQLQQSKSAIWAKYSR